MKTSLILLLLLITRPSVAQNSFVVITNSETLTVTNWDGQVLTGIRIIRADADGLLYLWADGSGGGRIATTNLSAALCRKYGSEIRSANSNQMWQLRCRMGAMAPAISNQLMTMDIDELSELLTVEVARRAAERSNRATAQRQPPARPIQEPSRDGVPLSIYNQIAADAAKDWPGDYTMQSWRISRQIEDYRKLHP